MKISKLKYKWTTEEDYQFHLPEYNGRAFQVTYHNHVLASITPEGVLTIHKGYSWDGCTPKWVVTLFGETFNIGVWDGKNTYEGRQQMYYPSLVHDILCQIYYNKHGINFYTRKDIDRVFKMIAKSKDYKVNPLMRHVYYLSCRLYGGFVKVWKGY